MTAYELPKQYNPFDTEAKWQAYWEEQGLFRAASKSSKESYCIMMAPPNVTGSLHMGHAFEKTIADVLIRYHRMKGFNTLWLPGKDHASIAVHTVLERQLRAEGKTRQDLGRSKFLERAWDWKGDSSDRITNQIRKLGASVDWQRERFTLDQGLSKAVIEAFVSMYEDGLIYRGEYLVNWCPASQSAVSDLEVENQETNGHLWHFRYPLTTGDGYLVVATTRPETMLGDTAVAVNPKDDRYQHLIGQTVTLPIMNREIPIVGDEYVDMEFGTGCVKITPAHDFNDFEIGQRHDLPMINVMNKDATINENGGEFAGQDRFVARKNIVAKLDSLGLLDHIEDYVHAVPYSERGKVPIEPFLSMQWFAKTRAIADFAMEQLDQHNSPQIVPERWHKVYRDWLVKIKDWCISRQLWWGHQIPAWYTPEGEIFVAHNETEAKAKAKAKLGREVELVQDEDVLDTWFSSGLWPFSTLGWPEQTEDLETFYPTSVLICGFDIIFFWVARMTMMAGYFTKQMPFKDVYIHGLVRDENNQKMSKTKNNGIDPLVLIDKYGTDALRYALINEVVGAGQDIRLDYNRKTDESSTVESARNFANKLWNASRFVLMNLGDDRPKLPALAELESCDRWILSRFNQTAQMVNQQIPKYGLGEAARTLYGFIWNEFCDYYIELVKPRLQSEDQRSQAIAQGVLLHVLKGTLALLHPYMPHLTEEIWSAVASEAEKPLAIQPYPEAADSLIDSAIDAQFNSIFEAIRVIRNLRAELEIKPSQKIKAVLQGEGDELHPCLAGAAYIKHLARVEELQIVETVPADLGQTMAGVVGTVQVLVPLTGVVDVAQLRQRLEKNLGKLNGNIASLQGRLSNEGYVKKAPAHIVEGARAELEEAKQQAQILTGRLEQLQQMN